MRRRAAYPLPNTAITRVSAMMKQAINLRLYPPFGSKRDDETLADPRSRAVTDRTAIGRLIGHTHDARASRGRAFCLSAIEGPFTGREWRFADDAIALGRGENNDLRLHDACLSRDHAQIA